MGRRCAKSEVRGGNQGEWIGITAVVREQKRGGRRARKRKFKRQREKGRQAKGALWRGLVGEAVRGQGSEGIGQTQRRGNVACLADLYHVQSSAS